MRASRFGWVVFFNIVNITLDGIAHRRVAELAIMIARLYVVFAGLGRIISLFMEDGRVEAIRCQAFLMPRLAIDFHRFRIESIRFVKIAVVESRRIWTREDWGR